MATLTNQNGTSSVDTLTYNKAGTYHAGAGNDNIKIEGGSGIVVYADSGLNIINVTGGSQHTVKIAVNNAEGDKVNGNDKLNINGADQVDAHLGSGKDEITLANTQGRKSGGALSQIRGGLWGDTFTTNTGAQGYQLYGDAGNDIFNIVNGSNLICWGGAASDTFNVTGGTGIKLRGGDSDDIYNLTYKANAVDMQLGYGKDLVKVYAGDNHVIKANLGVNTIYLKAGTGHVITSDVDQTISKKRGYTDEQIKKGEGVGYGVDKVYIDGATKVKANLGDGKDVLEILSGSNHTLFTEGWGDTITLAGTASFCGVDAGTGDDYIEISGSASYSDIWAGEGNDVIEFKGSNSNNYLYAGAGNDTINISGGSGNVVKPEGGNNTINISGGTGTNIKDMTGGNNTINVTAGDVNEIISEATGELKLNISGEGNVRNLYIYAGKATIKAEQSTKSFRNLLVDKEATEVDAWLGSAGNYVRLVTGHDHFIVGNSGKDEISGSGISYSSFQGKGGDDKLTLYGTQETTHDNMLEGGEGKDTIILTGGFNNTILGGKGEDEITLQDNSDRGIFGKNNTAKGEEGDDRITIRTSYAEVYGGDGMDYLDIANSLYCHIRGGNDNDAILAGNNTTHCTLNGNAGADHIVLKGSCYFNTVTGDDGDDTIEVTNGMENTISGGGGIDYITVTGSSRNTIEGGVGDDNITVSGGAANKVLGGYGQDKINIYNSALYSEVYGGQDSDYIYISNNGSHSKISGGDGADIISFTTTQGYDRSKDCVIYGGSGNDLIQLNSGLEYSTIIAGLGDDEIQVGTTAAADLMGNKIVGGAGSDTYKVNMVMSHTFIDAATGQGSTDKDVVELYVASDFVLELLHDSTNRLDYYKHASSNSIYSGGTVLLKYASNSKATVKFYNVRDFGKDSKTEITSSIMSKCKESTANLAALSNNFGADYNDSQYELYNSLANFLNGDSDLKIAGNR